MEWDRNRRYDEHRGGESYRPPPSRNFIRRSRSPRNRSPRLVADTWVPSPGRSYGRLRSRSPNFRRRSRSPPFYKRDLGSGSYPKACSPQRFSPRREGRHRSPLRAPWRSRSPYGEIRSRDFSRDRAASTRPRDISPPNQDFRAGRRDRPLLSPTDQYTRSSSHSRRGHLSTAPVDHRSRSPFPQGRRDRYIDKFSRRPSLSPRGPLSSYTSATGSVSNSRRPSPSTDRLNSTSIDARDRSPIAQSTTHRGPYKDLDGLHLECTPPTRPRFSKDEVNRRSPVTDHIPISVGKASNSDKCGPIRSAGDQSKAPGPLENASPLSIPSHPKSNSLHSQSPPSGPSHGPKPVLLHGRGSNISLLSAPTRPRGGPSFKENIWASRRGPNTPSSHPTPTGPRMSHAPAGPGVELHRHHTYRQNSAVTASHLPFARTPKYMNHLVGSASVIPGGRLFSSSFDLATEKRFSQLEMDKDRLLEQISDCQKQTRVEVRDWDRLDGENFICALKSELAEGHLQRISEGESMHGTATF